MEKIKLRRVRAYQDGEWPTIHAQCLTSPFRNWNRNVMTLLFSLIKINANIYQIKVKEYRRQELYVTLPTRWGPYDDFKLGLQISANVVGIINTAKSLHKSRKQFTNRRKRSPSPWPRSWLGFTSILIHLMHC